MGTPALVPNQSDPIDDFIALPQEQQLSTLQQLSPENQEKLLGQVRERKSKGQSQANLPSASEPGLFQKLSNWANETFPNMEKPDTESGTSFFSPKADQFIANAGTRMIRGLAGIPAGLQNLYEGFKNDPEAMAQRIGPGGIVPAAQQAKEYVDTARTKGIGQAGSDIIGDLGAGLLAGEAAGAVGNVLKPSLKTAANRLTFAAGKGLEHIEPTLNDLRVASKGAPVKTVDDFLSTVNRAKDAMNAESGAAIFPIQHKTVSTLPIANRIRSLITPNMAMTAEGRAAMRQIENAALEFERPGWTVGQLDHERMDRFANLTAHNKKSPVVRYAAEQGSTNIAIDKAVNDAIRDTIYPEMDRAAGKPAGYFQNLKQRQANLIQLQDILDGRVKELKNASAKAAGAPRFSAENLGRPVTMEGTKAGLVGAAKNAVIRSNPFDTASKAAKSGFSRLHGGQVGAAVGSLPVRVLLGVEAVRPTESLDHPIFRNSPFAQ